MESKPTTVLVITHGPCTDGAGSAWVIDRHFRNLSQDTDQAVVYQIEHHRIQPNKAGDMLQQFADEKKTADLVFSSDIGYFGKDLEKLIAMYPDVVVIDHHLSSYRDIINHYYFKYLAEHDNVDVNGLKVDDAKKEEMRGVIQQITDNVTQGLNQYLPSNYLYDVNESGATLTWKYFYQEQPMPELLLYIRDRDLWRWEMPNSRLVNDGLYQIMDHNPMDNDWTIWDGYATDKTLISRALELGQITNKTKSRKIGGLFKHVLPFKVHWQGKTYTGGSINTTEEISDLGNFICNHKDKEKHLYDFALVWRFSSEGVYYCSLRSRKNSIDVGSLAKALGGGGHACAAGCSLNNIFDLIGRPNVPDESDDIKAMITSLTSIPEISEEVQNESDK